MNFKKKIDSMKGSFRKELKKVKESKKTGTGADEVYTPHLWYFEHFLFLEDHETPRQSQCNIGVDQEHSDGDSQEVSQSK